MRACAGARGFTLIELIVTVAIVALLATAAAPMAQLALQRADEGELRRALREIRGAIDAYHAAASEGRIVLEQGQSGYPPSLTVLVEGVVDARDPEGRRIYFLRRLPRDPMFPDAQAAPETTWGLRSYASAPGAPLPGEDVYDVRSLHPGSGLDGTAYAQW